MEMHFVLNSESDWFLHEDNTEGTAEEIIENGRDNGDDWIENADSFLIEWLDWFSD